jgi:hypothetical protein
MADTKISALTTLVAGDIQHTSDVVAIVDTSVTTTKKATAQAVVNAVLAQNTDTTVTGTINQTTIPTSKTLLVSTDIGSTVQGYDATTLKSADIGVTVQGYDAQLADVAGLAVTDGNFIVGNGTNFVAESGATARTSLGLGTGDSPEFTAVNIGSATDTTITRSSAGVIAVEGSNVLMASNIGTTVQGYDADTAKLDVAQTFTAAQTFNNPTVFSAGTASLPSITFTGDTNTGIFSPAADTIAITAGGTNKAQFGTGSATIDGLTVGRGAGAVATNTAVGASALAVNEAGGNNNTAVGYQTLDANTTGDFNTALGSQSLGANTTGEQNSAVGGQALAANTTGSNNVAFGYVALTANTTASDNSAFGVSALTSNTTGTGNHGIGRSALRFNTTGNYNTAVGMDALRENTTASNNTAVGYQALYANTTGTNNSAFGVLTLDAVTTGGGNTAFGNSAGGSLTTGSSNTFIGEGSGSTTTGDSNTFLGRDSGYLITSGTKNTVIGRYSGNQGSLDIRTLSNYIVLSDGDGNPRSWFGANGAGTNWACAKDDGDITMLYGPANLTPNTARSARLGFITNSLNKNWYMAHSWLTTGSLEFVQTAANGGSTMGGTAAFSLNSSGNGIFTGSLSKGSGSFRIDHPLPQLEETHHLVHSFIEGPQADLIYRGKVNLVSGRAEVNIDLASGMTEGTFVALCRDVQCFTTNESDWVHVRGSVSGNVLTIEAQDQAATSLISWMVIGERQDKHMIDTDWTDDNGKVIVEPIKPPKIERTERTEVQS